MGWKDINMNRRKPQLHHAVVPLEAGEDREAAVLRKAAAAALAMLPQAEDWDAKEPDRLKPFTAGYLAGYARHQALKHGVDAEQDELAALLRGLALAAPKGLADAIAGLAVRPRPDLPPAPRCRLRILPSPLADSGYLVGQLESLCRSARLLKAAGDLGGRGQAGDFLTACDVAADRMQTHQPTMSLRFDEAERTIIRAAFQGV